MFPDSVTVYHKLSMPPQVSTSSFVLDVVILSERHQRPAARCVEDIVLYDYQAGQKLELGSRPFILKAFERTWIAQEEARKAAKVKAAWVEGMIRRVEMATWDREGAVEDMGP